MEKENTPKKQQHYHGISFEFNHQSWYLEKSYHQILDKEGYQIILTNHKENISVVLDNFVPMNTDLKKYMGKAIDFIKVKDKTNKQALSLENKLI